MLCKENSDYINVNLKRIATNDELYLLDAFWKSIIPYRFLRRTNKKLFKKNVFGSKVIKKIKINKHYLFVKSNYDKDIVI